MLTLFKLKQNTLRNTVPVMLFVLFIGLIFCQTANAEPVKANIPELIDLGASQCMACKKMAVILDELTEEYKETLKVTFIDVWKNENVAKAKEFNVQSIPTQIFRSPEGKILWRHVGFISKEDIIAKWKELGFEINRTKSLISSDTTSLPAE